MSVTATAKLRRRQSKQNHNHLAPQQRPNYSRPSAEKSAARLSKLIQTERRIQQNKGNKTKK